MDILAKEILDFWEGIGPKGWYEVNPDVDSEITTRFHDVWKGVRDGKHKDWQLDAQSALALIILLDQFPRNMFRGHADAFSSDRKALCIAQKAIRKNYDQQIDALLRQFFYLPLMHSESIMDQDAAVRAFATRMPGDANLLHAQAHREVIREFGRFPYRNAVLGRKMTSKEDEYLAAGGYGHTVRGLQK